MNKENDRDIQKYNKLNNSFNKKLVFHLGAGAGFFSEYNNMILAMLYCLNEKIKFSIYSCNANFKKEKGWTDYFLPFCEEDHNRYHSKYNRRMPIFGLQKRFLIADKFNKLIDPVKKAVIKRMYFENSSVNYYFTYELWNKFHNQKMESIFFNIPELSIKGNLREATSKLVKMTWRFNEPTKVEVEQLIRKLNLPEEYIGFHMRRGDKEIECEIRSIHEYIEKAKLLTTIRNAFILTDDFGIIQDLVVEYPQWTFYTLCNQNEKGYFHEDFMKMATDFKNENQIRLFASIEILASAKIFIGTYSSNPGMYLGMRLPVNQCYAIDFDSWHIC